MTTDVVSYMLLAVVGTRLLVDRALRPWALVSRRGLLLAILAVCAVPLASPGNLGLLAAVILGLVIVDFLVLAVSRESELGKAWAAAVTVAIVALAFTTAPLSDGFNAVTVRIAGQVAAVNALAALGSGRLLREAGLFTAGMLLSSFELHHPIVWAIARLNVAPTAGDTAEPPAAPAEIDRGQIIGYLERPIVFILIATGNYVSLGLLFAAKTLTRFRKLNSRGFAEYYLIGTLLSFGSTALLAILLSFLAGT
jgi:hypothetical protein